MLSLHAHGAHMKGRRSGVEENCVEEVRASNPSGLPVPR
jgi:hypothetical protein